MEDITKTGTKGLQGLKGINQRPGSNIRPEIQLLADYVSSMSSSQRNQVFKSDPVQDAGIRASRAGYGNSIYDDEALISDLDEPDGLNEVRAANQGVTSKLASGLIKGVGLAATTFVDGTLGLLYGIGTGIANLADDNPDTGFWLGLFNNDVSNGLNELNKAMEKILPNYYSKREQNMSLLEKLGTANFWADGLLKNMGFMVGAFYSGNLITKGLKIARLVKSTMGAQVAGSLISGVNEGRIEANLLYNDTKKLSTLLILDKYNKRKQEILGSDLTDSEKIQALTDLSSTNNALLLDAENRANEAAGVDLLANCILLPLDNFYTYGKLYGQGFKNVKNLGGGNVKKSFRQRSKEAIKDAEKHMGNDLEENVTLEGSKYVWKDITRPKVLKKGLITGLREGNEEMLQQFFSSTAGYMYQPESPDAYYKAMVNNKNQVEAQDTLTAMANGFADSYGDGSQYEQFVVGALTALIGTPTFGKAQNSSSNTYLGRGKTIGLSGGLLGEFSNARDINKRGQLAVNDINRVQKKISDGKISLAMSIGFNNDMEGYAKENDKFEYQNAADNDLFRLFSRFVSIGREGDFRDMVDLDFDNISDEELEKIAAFTSKTPDVLNYSDGFRNEDGTLMSSTEEGRKKMREKLKERKNHLLKQMDSYKDALGTVRGMTNNSLSPDLEDELAWLLWKSKRFKERADEVKERYGEGLDSIIEALNIRKDELESTLHAKLQKYEILGKAAMNSINENDVNDTVRANEEASREIKELQESLRKNEILASIVNGMKLGKLGSGLMVSNMEVTDEKGNKTPLAEILLSEDFYKNFVKTGKDYSLYKNGLIAVLDTVKLLNARNLFSDKLAEYMSKPEKLAKNRAKIDENEAKKTNDSNNLKVKDKVAHSLVNELVRMDDDELSELENMLNDNEDSEELTKITEARKVKNSKKNIKDKIELGTREGAIPLEAALDAMSLLEANSIDANSLEELEDIDSEAILGADIDTSELEAVLQLAIDEGNGSTEEALAALKKEKERRKDAARTVLRESIRKVLEDRKKSESMPKSAPEVIDNGSAPGKDTGGATAIPVNPTPIVEKAGNDIVDYIKDLAAKGYSEKDIFESVKDLNAYKEAIDAGFTEADIKQEIGNAVREQIAKKNKTSAPKKSDNGTISVDSDEITEDEDESFNPGTLDFDRAVDDSNTHSSETGPKPINGTYTYWRPATTEFKIHRSRGDNQPYYKDAKVNAATKKRYEAVWNFLKKLNAFERVKSLKIGDTVHFGISKELSNNAGVPVLLILNENNEVLGDLPVQEDSGFSAYPGLDDAYKVATTYYNEHKNDSSDDVVVIANMTSTVNAKLIGKPQYTEREDRRTLNKINTITQADGSKKAVPFKLGVAVTSGKNPRIMVTPGRRSSQSQTGEEVMVQRPLEAKFGQPFMLMETSKQRGGTSGNVKVCVPISMPKFSITNPRTANSELGQIIQEKLAEIATIKGNKDSILKWIREVKELLAIESLHVDFTPGSLGLEGRSPQGLVITMKKYGEPRTVIYRGPQNSDTIVTALLNHISMNGGTQFSISRKYINGKYRSHDYNSMIGALATTNLPEGATHTVNDWFSINPIIEGLEKKGKGPVNLGENPNSSKDMFLLTIDGVTYGLGDNNKTYKEENGKYVECNTSREFKAHMHGMKFGVNMSKPYTTPWGYYNPSTQKFEEQNTEVMQNKKQELSSTLSTQSSRITFDSDTHTYTVDGKKTDTSVTQYIHRNDKTEAEKDPVLGFLEISARLGDTIDSLARQYFDGKRVVKPKNMTDRQFARVMSTLMELKDQITDLVGEGWVAITDENLLRVAGTIDEVTLGGTIDMLIKDKNGKYRIIDFKTKRVNDSGIWKLEGKTLEQYEQQVKIYQRFLEDMNPEMKGQFDTPLLATFATEYQRPRGSRQYETGEVIYTEDNGAILINGNPIELSKGYNPGSLKGIREVREATSIPVANGIDPIEVKPEDRRSPAEKPNTSEPVSDKKAPTKSPVEEKKTEKEEPKKPTKKAPSKPTVEKNTEVKPREKSLSDIENKGLLPSNKPERRALLDLLDDASLSGLSELPKMRLKLILEKVAAGYRQGMSLQEISQLFSDAGYNGVGQFRRAPWWLERAKEIYFDKVYGRDLSEWEVFKINQELERLAMSAGDSVPWVLRQSYRTGNWYIAGRRNMAVTMEGYTLNNRFREVDEDTSVWDKDKEMDRAAQMLPQLSKEGRVRLVDGLIKISDSENPGYAWGMLKRGTIVLSDRAARGTLYHESFHFVSQVLMSRSERNRLYKAAALRYGNKSLMDLEELLAEDFRRYTQGIEDTEVKQMNFIQRMFSSIRDVIRGIRGKNIELDQLFSEINRGRYARRKAKISTDTLYAETQFSKEMQDIKAKAIADGTFMKAPNGKPTNLNERQWLQVRTTAFKNWFGDWQNDPDNASKVVDENGEPLVVYHTTKEVITPRINIFKKQKRYKSNSLFYFSNSKESSQTYFVGSPTIGDFTSRKELLNEYKEDEEFRDINTLQELENIVINKIELINKEINILNNRISNKGPKILGKVDLNTGQIIEKKSSSENNEIYSLQSDLIYYNNILNNITPYIRVEREGYDNIKEMQTYQVFLNIKTPLIVDAKNMSWDTFNRSLGIRYDFNPENFYFKSRKNEDGFIITNFMDASYERDTIISTTYAVENPNQIKSATSNTGEFSTTNDDIRYRRVDSERIRQYHREKLQYGNLTQEQKDYIKLRNISIEDYNDMSDVEKEVLFHCMS